MRTSWMFIFVMIGFGSCYKELVAPVSTFKGKVIIVGAGISGLYAAKLLNERGIDVQIFEASSKIGGRMRSLEQFADFPIELGAEEVHGEKSTWYNILKGMKTPFVNEKTTDYFQLDGKLRSEDDLDKNDDDYAAAQKFVDNIGDYHGAEQSVEQYVKSQGLPVRVHPLLNSWIGNEYGTDNSKLGVLSLAEGDQKWESGNKNFLLKGVSMESILQDYFKNIIPKIKLNTPIKSINYQGDQINLVDAAQLTYQASFVIITVPLKILKDDVIQFIPKLPADKVNAIRNIGMDIGMKVILKFKKRFWADDLGSLYGGGYVPEFWSTGNGRSKDNTVLTAFVNGPKAAYLSSKGDQAIQIILSELDGMYGKGIASGQLEKSFIMDWSKEPWIRGVYSFPSPNSDALRADLAKPVNNKIYFAGEAANTKGNFGSVHGAIQAAEVAVDQLIKFIGK